VGDQQIAQELIMKMGHKMDEPALASSKPEKNPMYYPSLHLDAKESKAIPEGVKPGQTLKAEITAKVSSVSINDDGDGRGERRRVTLEIHDLTIEGNKGSSEAEKKALGYDRSKDPNSNRNNREKMKTPKAKELQ
jgi:hypothetical protein